MPPSPELKGITGPSASKYSSTPTQSADTSLWLPVMVMSVVTFLGMASLAVLGRILIRSEARQVVRMLTASTRPQADLEALSKLKGDIVVALDQLEHKLAMQWKGIQGVVALERLKGDGQHLVLALQAVQLVEGMLVDSKIQLEIERAREALFRFLQAAIAAEKMKHSGNPRELQINTSANASPAAEAYQFNLADGKQMPAPAMKARFVDPAAQKWLDVRKKFRSLFQDCGMSLPGATADAQADANTLGLEVAEMARAVRNTLATQYREKQPDNPGRVDTAKKFWEETGRIFPDSRRDSADIECVVVWSDSQSPLTLELPSIQFSTMNARVRGLKIRRLSRPSFLKWESALSTVGLAAEFDGLKAVNEAVRIRLERILEKLPLEASGEAVDKPFALAAEHWCQELLRLRSDALRSRTERGILLRSEFERWDPLLEHVRVVAREQKLELKCDSASAAQASESGKAYVVEWLMADMEGASVQWLMPELRTSVIGKGNGGWVLVPTSPRKPWQRALALAARAQESKDPSRVEQLIDPARAAMQLYERFSNATPPDVKTKLIRDFWLALWDNTESDEWGSRCREALRNAMRSDLSWKCVDWNQGANEYFVAAPSDRPGLSRPALMEGDVCRQMGSVPGSGGEKPAPRGSSRTDIQGLATQEERPSAAPTLESMELVASQLDALFDEVNEPGSSPFTCFRDSHQRETSPKPQKLKSCFTANWASAFEAASKSKTPEALTKWMTKLNGVLISIGLHLDLEYKELENPNYYEKSSEKKKPRPALLSEKSGFIMAGIISQISGT